MNIQTKIKFHYSTKDGQNKNPMQFKVSFSGNDVFTSMKHRVDQFLIKILWNVIQLFQNMVLDSLYFKNIRLEE